MNDPKPLTEKDAQELVRLLNEQQKRSRQKPLIFTGKDRLLLALLMTLPTPYGDAK